MAVKLGEGNHIALGRPWFPVVRHRHDPFWPRRRSVGAQESFLLELQQPALRHRRRAPVISGDKSHRHLQEEGEWLCYCSRVRAREMVRRQKQEQGRKAEEATAERSEDIYRRRPTNGQIRRIR